MCQKVHELADTAWYARSCVEAVWEAQLKQDERCENLKVVVAGGWYCKEDVRFDDLCISYAFTFVYFCDFSCRLLKGTPATATAVKLELELGSRPLYNPVRPWPFGQPESFLR